MLTRNKHIEVTTLSSGIPKMLADVTLQAIFMTFCTHLSARTQKLQKAVVIQFYQSKKAKKQTTVDFFLT